MLDLERWITGSAKDAADVIRKALTRPERYVRTIQVTRQGASKPEFHKFVITIQYGEVSVT